MRKLAILLTTLIFSTGALATEKTVTLMVENMTCATCPITVRAAIRGVSGVTDVKVDFTKKIAVVVFDDAVTTSDALANVSRDAGFPASIKE